MIMPINFKLLNDLTSHTRHLGIKRFFQSTGYERCAEFPLVASRLEPLYSKKFKYLDIGSGQSIFPTYLLKRTAWDITCVDKFSWVQTQHEYARRVMGASTYKHRFHVLEQDFLEMELPEASFDIVTNVSVIEHFEDDLDIAAIKKSAMLIKPGGIYILTTLINDKYFKEFFLRKNVYGKNYQSDPVFFQRHYDVESFNNRIVRTSMLKERERLYFGDYGFQFSEKFMYVPWPWKPLKIFYQWATPFFARMFCSYRDYPISRPDMHMYTASGVFVVLGKE